jgi:hypothetical protein
VVQRNSRQTKFEIELKSRKIRRRVAIFIHERQSELDDFEKIYVAAKQLVLVVGCGSKFADWSGDDTCAIRRTHVTTCWILSRRLLTWKFGVHCDIAVFGDDFANKNELLLEIVAPDVAYSALLVNIVGDLVMIGGGNHGASVNCRWHC